jgi:glycosyltransferase involved in cell wall biosynthesis
LSNVSKPAQRYKIVYLIDGLSMGGAERLTTPILTHLSRAHFDPYVCALQSKDGNPLADEIRALGVQVDCLHIKHLRDWDAMPRLVGYLRNVGADLVHTQLEAANILGNISAKLLRLPSVCTIHVMPSLEVKTKTKIHQKVEWFCLRRYCDRVISVSEEARQYHIDISGTSPNRVTTIYNGIDLSTFINMDHARERASVRAELGIPPEAPVLVTVAVLRPQKGIQFLIRALPSILASSPRTYYLIVGSGSHHDALIEETNKSGVDEHVVFAGMRTDVPRLLAASDVFVLPTLTEALPTVLAEAMAARLPVVASRVGGIPEMIEEGQNGLLVEAKDLVGLASACTRLLGDAGERAALGGQGWKIVNQKFNIERQVDQLEELYLEQLRAYGKS